MRMAGIGKILKSLCCTWPMSNKETHFKKSQFNRVNNIEYGNVVFKLCPSFFSF